MTRNLAARKLNFSTKQLVVKNQWSAHSPVSLAQDTLLEIKKVNTLKLCMALLTSTSKDKF